MNYATDRSEKRKRIDWCKVFNYWCHGDPYIVDDFNRWCRNHKKVHSVNKQAYCYLLKINGRDWIKAVRDFGGVDALERIIKTPWIKEIYE